MLQEQFDILGFWDDEIYFRLNDDIIMLKKRLPREDMILKLKVEPEDCKELKDAILFDAAKKPLSHDQRQELFKETK